MSLEKPPACNMAIDPLNTNVLIKRRSLCLSKHIRWKTFQQ